MATTTEPARPILRRCLMGVVSTALIAAGALLDTPSAQAAGQTITPVNDTLTITTSGWGHGRGLSQYGAKMAAQQGLAYKEILSFYYPGTKLGTLPAKDIMRVWIKADDDSATHVYPAKGLRLTDTAGHVYTLPSGKNYTKWRISRSGNKRVLYYRNAKGKYVKFTSKKFKLNPAKTWYFDNPTSGKVKLYLASGNRTYRGKLSLVFSGSSSITVNTVPTESYLRSVVPSEMPASWSAEALKAQAVAARSYAARYRANLAKQGKPYSICNTTACQVYKGTMTEHPASDAAVKATAGKVLTYQNQYVWAEFSSSNGGYTKAGDHDYMQAKEDPYDRSANQVWAIPVTTKTIEKKYPKIGTFKSVTLVRDGNGLWGGRVTSVTLTGSKGTQKVSGTAFKSALGLRETMLTVTGGLAKGTANYERWQDDFGGSKGALLGVPAGSEQVRSGGLYAPFEKGSLWWSKATGSHRLTTLANQAYVAAGGPEKSGLGFPTSDAGSITSTKVAGITSGTEVSFQGGLISCPANAKEASACVITQG